MLVSNCCFYSHVVVVIVAVYVTLSRLLFLAFSAILGLQWMPHPGKTFLRLSWQNFSVPMFCACALTAGEKAPCTLEVTICLSKLQKGNQHHIHGILYTDKSNFKYIDTKKLRKFQKSSTELS